MDVNARTLRLWEHACCGDRYWSATRLCDRCGTDAFAVLVKVSLADAMARMHFHAQPAAVPAPAHAATPSIKPSAPPAGGPPQALASRAPGPPVPAPRRPPIRTEVEVEPPVAQPGTGQPSDPGLAFLLGTCVAGGLVFVVTCLLMLA